MFELEAYFDLRVGDVLLMDPTRLVPPDPEAARLRRQTADGWTVAQRLERAHSDLARIRDGWLPSRDVFLAAPVLAGWKLVITAGGLALEGNVNGHPGISPGNRALTSAIIAFDVAGQQWARTVSRFYRLASN